MMAKYSVGGICCGDGKIIYSIILITGQQMHLPKESIPKLKKSKE